MEGHSPQGGRARIRPPRCGGCSDGRLGIHGLSLDHLGAGNEVVDAAAVLVEDEADVDETINITSQRNCCDQSVYENAQQDRFYTARIVSVRKGDDTSAEYSLPSVGPRVARRIRE